MFGRFHVWYMYVEGCRMSCHRNQSFWNSCRLANFFIPVILTVNYWFGSNCRTTDSCGNQYFSLNAWSWTENMFGRLAIRRNVEQWSRIQCQPQALLVKKVIESHSAFRKPHLSKPSRSVHEGRISREGVHAYMAETFGDLIFSEEERTNWVQPTFPELYVDDWVLPADQSGVMQRSSGPAI